MLSTRDDILTLVPAQQLSPKKTTTTVKSNQQPILQPSELKVISKLQVGDIVKYLKVVNNRGKILLVESSNIKELSGTVTTIKLTEHIIDIPNEDKVRLATLLISNPSISIIGYAVETPSGYYIIQRSSSSIFPTEINLVISGVEYNHTESEIIVYPIVNLYHINDTEVNIAYDNLRREERIKSQELLKSTRTTVVNMLDSLDKYIKIQKNLFDKLDQVISDFETIQDEYIGIDIDNKDRENLMLLTKTLRERHEVMIDLIRSCQNINSIRTYLNQIIVNIDTYNREISKVFDNIEYAVKD